MSWLSRAVSTVTKPLRALDDAVGGAAGWGKAVGFVSPVGAVAAVGIGKATGNNDLAGGAIAGAATSFSIGAAAGGAIAGTKLGGVAAQAAGKWATTQAPASPASRSDGFDATSWTGTGTQPAPAAAGSSALPKPSEAAGGASTGLVLAGVAVVALLLLTR